ncbi:MAG: GW dipeptide domain-containing protein [Bacteroidota bacterium]
MAKGFFFGIKLKQEVMDFVKKLLFAGLILMVAGCNRSTESGLTTVKVLEVEQVANYTYLLVKARGPEYWIAVPTMEAGVGDTYQYQGGMLMEDFHSKELDRTFDEVLFLEALFSTSEPVPGTQAAPGGMAGHEAHPAVQEVTPGSKVKTQRADVSVEAAEGTTLIADLFANPGDFDGKTIRVKGEVTKYNAAIMQRNWVHIQDGTEHEGKFDLTATSIESFEVGIIVTLEGVLAINKDFGYGYSYEILLEQARAIE